MPAHAAVPTAADATTELVCAAQIENAVAASGEAFVKATDAYVGALVSTATSAAATIAGAATSIVASWQAAQGTHYADYVSAVISAGLKRWQGDLASDLAQAAAEAHADAVLSAAESSADARAARQIAGAGLAWATIVGPAWSAAAAAQAQAAADSNGAFADASQDWTRAIGSAFVGWAMSQAQADADFGIAGAIAGATAGNAAAAAGSMFTAAASKAAGDLTRALNAVQTGFVDAATAASLKATKTIAAAETVERKAVAKTNVVLAKDLQAAWGTYASAECGAVILNARERATIGADYKKEVAGAELAAVKEVAPARKTSMVAAAEANGAYEVKVSAIVADLGILGGQIHVEQVKASQSLISPATLKKWLDSLSIWGETTAAFAKGLAQGVANLGNAAQDVGVGLLNVPAASVNFGSWASEKLFFDVPDHMKIRMPYVPSPDWSKGMVTQESDFDHGLSKGSLEVAVGIFGPGAIGRIRSAAAIGTMPLSAGKATGAYLPGAAGGGSGLGLFETHSVRVSQKGLELIRNHLSRFGDCEQNSMMMQRLRSAAADGCTISGADASFYMHEAAEATLMARGLSYPAAHAASLQKYGVSQYSVYHPSVVAALPQWFNKNWRNYWGMQ